MRPWLRSLTADVHPYAVISSALLLAAALLSLLGCQPSLPDASDAGAGGGGGGTSAPSLVVEPAASLDAIPRAVRFHLQAGAELDPASCVIATDELGDAHLRQLADRELSGAFTERLLPIRSWSEAYEGEGGVVLAPAVLLEAGATYTVACGVPSLSFHVTVASSDPLPVLGRLWPPAGASATTAFAIWCGDEPAPDLELPAALAPGGPTGRLRAGEDAALPPGCVRFAGEADASGEASQPSPFEDAPGVTGWLPPVVVPFEAGATPLFALEPSPLARDVEPPVVTALPCEAAAPLTFGPGCAALLDDRIHASAPEARLLWLVEGSVRWFAEVAAGDPFVVAPLQPDSAVMLEVTTFDVAGAVRGGPLAAASLPAMAHVVLSEVLANPLGAEPQQEWVELHNTGLAAAELGGMVLADIGGETVLPTASLAPGAFALVVGESFVDDDGLDPPVPPGALLLRVEKVGKSGLANGGEPLELRGLDGAVISRFPAAPKPKPGGSVARVAPLAADGIASSFAHAVPTPGASNSLLPAQ